MKVAKDVLYVQNVIESLERKIRKMQVCNEASLEEQKVLDHLLLENYLLMEKVLKERLSD